MLPVSRGRLIRPTCCVLGSMVTTIIVSVLSVASLARPASRPTSRIERRWSPPVHGGTLGPTEGAGVALAPGARLAGGTVGATEGGGTKSDGFTESPAL